LKNIENDALDCENIKESFRKRTKEAAHSLVEKANSVFQSGEGYKKQKRKRTKRKRKLVKRKLLKRKQAKKNLGNEGLVLTQNPNEKEQSKTF
jgi:hypothetical protein